MGRHASPLSTEDDGARSPVATWVARLAIGLALLLAFGVGIGLSFVDTSALIAKLPGQGPQGSACPSAQVALVVSPEVKPVVDDLVTPLQRRRVMGECLTVDVTAQEPYQTVASASILPRDRWPQLWIPDSSAWLNKSGELTVISEGTFATSPLVVATRSDDASLPKGATWAQVLGGRDSVALLHPDTTATGIGGLAAVAATAGEKSAAALTATMHAIVQDGAATATSPLQALEAGGEYRATLAVTSEQSVIASQKGTGTAEIVPFYPAPASPLLDYPVGRISGALWSDAQREGARLILDALTGQTAAAALHAAGFRTPDGTTSDAAPLTIPETVDVMPPPTTEAVDSITTLLTDLAKPTRMLTVLDVSTSMQALADARRTRIQLVGDVVRAASAGLDGNARVGIWAFASDLDGSKDYRELAPIRKLDDDSAGTTQRQLILDAADDLADHLVPGGTSLYDTAYAAVKEVADTFDPTCSNAVVMITDGVNEDSSGLTLKQVKAKLKQVTADAPVRFIAIAVGPDTDLSALQQMAGATPQGKAYKVEEASQMQAVLFDALSSRR